MARSVHRNEIRKVKPLFTTTFLNIVIDDDAAKACRRRKDVMMGINMHDVFIFGDRPIGPVSTLSAIVDSVFFAQTFEIGASRIVLEKRW